MSESRTRPFYYDSARIGYEPATLDVPVCIYGGSSAGLGAAVQLARLGVAVVVLEPGRHLGGLSAGGLGWTDFGRKQAIGGLAREFYRAVGAKYGLAGEEWRFAPSVAEQVFNDWVRDAGIDVRFNQFVSSVVMDGRRLSSITMTSGLTVRARLFMDASYEGDLLARAGVSYTVGRESNDRYGEKLNGIQVRTKHQFSHRVDPFVKAGDPASGLLPFVDGEDRTRQQGAGDRRVQAYCFRMCMTDDPALKVAWPRPADFDPRLYELAVRWFNAEKDGYNEQLLPDGTLAKFDVLPHKTPGGFHKTDTNNHGAVSSDFIGANYAWPEADYMARERIFQAHVSYQMGYYWFMANDERIPERYRRAYQRWGLPKDEFMDSGHWPHQLYIRESRRMVGDYVITEHDCLGAARAEDGVGLGSYNMDSHNCSRFVGVRDGQAWVLNDGDVQVPPTDPYPVSYRCLIPRGGECENLFVPVCFSASHIAYGSARMEPVFMVLGQSCGLAAKLALDEGVAVQAVPYGPLRKRLEAAGQVLTWTG